MGPKQGHNIDVGMRLCAIAMANAHAIVSSKYSKNSKIKNVKTKNWKKKKKKLVQVLFLFLFKG